MNKESQLEDKIEMLPEKCTNTFLMKGNIVAFAISEK